MEERVGIRGGPRARWAPGQGGDVGWSFSSSPPKLWVFGLCDPQSSRRNAELFGDRSKMPFNLL